MVFGADLVLPLPLPFPLATAPEASRVSTFDLALGSGFAVAPDVVFLGPFLKPSWVEDKFLSCCCSAMCRMSLLHK